MEQKKILLILGAVILAALLIRGVFFGHRLNNLLTLETTGQGWKFPSHVYSRPLTVSPEAALSKSIVISHLRDAGYLQIQRGALAPNQFQPTNNGVLVMTREQDYPGKHVQGKIFEISFTNNQVASILESDGQKPQDLLTLDPIRIGSFSEDSEDRRWVRLSEVPLYLADAVMAIEDSRFHQHHGLDLRGILRAAWRNFHAGHVVQGGSTITQQLAKNLFLTKKRTFRRKFLELFMALIMELRYSKEEILELYLNQIYLGQRGSTSIHGVEEGGRLYFGKAASQLTLAESALLAGLIRAPNNYSPHTNPKRALERRNVVLERMLFLKFISPEQYQQAKQEPLRTLPAAKATRQRAQYFLAYLHDKLTERYNSTQLDTQGLSIYTTLDWRLQKIAESLAKTIKPQAALVALDPKTGDLLAMVGGTDFSKTQFNRAVDAHRQPGSAFKPFVLTAALQNGFTLAKTELDGPLTVKTPQGDWEPQNYDGIFRGTTTVRESVVQSLNVPMARLAMEVGLDKVADCAHTLGITSPLKEVPSLALGASEVTLLELTRAYSPWANGGKLYELRDVIALYDHTGDVLESLDLSGQQVLSPELAYLVTNVLEDVIKEGTGRWVKDWGFTKPSAGKTGTTDNFRDAWFIGYTPNLVCGVWVGDDQEKSLGLSASALAIPLWAPFMKEALALEEDVPFVRPAGLSEIKIDTETGLLARSGCARTRKELFVKGTEPYEKCLVHAGGVKGFFKKLFGSEE